MKKHIPLGLFCLIISVGVARAQVDRKSDLFITLRQQDSIFFERSFNRCDMVYLESHIAADLRFYHDQGGFQDRKVFLENVRNNLCGGGPQKPIRKVDASSLVVYPLYADGKLYGAIQEGVHHFYLREQGKADVFTSTAKFSTVWTLEKDTWIMSVVLSFDHQSAPPK